MNTSELGSSSAIPAIKSPWKRLETWAILVFIIGCGFVAGWSVSQYFVWKQAKVQFDQLAFDYDESAKARAAILKMCLAQTQGAANEAAAAATAAQQAADKAVKAVKEAPK